MENAATLETEADSTVLVEELGYTDAPLRPTVLEEYFRGRAARSTPHIVEHVARPERSVIQTPFRIRCREVSARFGAILVFALAVAGIVWFWPPF